MVEKAGLYFIFLQKWLKRPANCAISGNRAGNMIKYIHIVKASAWNKSMYVNLIKGGCAVRNDIHIVLDSIAVAEETPLRDDPPAGKTWRYRMGGRRKKLAGNVCHGGSKRAAA